MGRHRRSAAGPVAGSAAETSAAAKARARRRKRSGMPVRTGLIGVSAAMAVGAVAVASGLLPGGGTYHVTGGAATDQIRSQGAPDLLTQGGSTTAPADRGIASAEAGRSTERSPGPRKSERSGSPGTSATPSASPSKTAERTEKAKAPAAAAAETTGSAPSATASAAPTTSAAVPALRATTPAGDTSARAAVLALVNQERAKVGCSPVTASAPLTSLAQNFSDDMAARGFFDHTDPDGRTPWDRASKAGVKGLGGENIARGQADAQAVMDSWMKSEGHRANILNCDYKTLGVGVHFGSGGPWWTQDFGF
ncbi:CAP domain-containing protein [Streptomyces sp. NBC_00841]|uniref:CAP domain-containing protein n=1 Tax=unclassified Streptomyces TaxID=2593676 RepID=UPI002253897C|nr:MULTISPECIES: CAP domain-containing protein [unclassified Streptomyces]MCX4532356.1 CAP domain-containing protein [Streptomyces sp. NBC_01669]WSA02146.1 CAP domain-containing protein [Streptomyces sp. NBC_00841]